MLHTAVETSLSAPFKLKVQTTRLTGEQFVHLCQENRDLRFELTAQKELVIMPPTGSESGWRSGEIFFAPTVWAKKNGAGLSFDSSTGFTLPNGAIRSPAASWVRREQWLALTPEQRAGFAPLSPYFVVELRSPSDQLAPLQEKMREYSDNGVQLGWLIDSVEKRVYLYRPGQPVASEDNPATLSGDPVLPTFVLDLRPLW